MRAPRNCWYVAAWSRDIGRALVARTILDTPVVLYRTEAGAPVALADRCPHRFAPLSKGTLQGDQLRCAYHGLVFDAAGVCRHVPGQRTIPPGTQVARYPTVERWGWVWIWMGEAAPAEPASIPDFHWNEAPDWAVTGGEMRINANYMLAVDNLLDLSHIAYLHPHTLGSDAVAEASDVTTERRDNGVRVTRWTLDAPTPPMWRTTRGHDGNIDRWQFVDFTAPSSVVLETGSAAAGKLAPDGSRIGAVTHMAMFAITPETATSTHYFWSNARNHRVGDAATTEALHNGILATFQEDAEMLEAQQRALDAPGAPPWIDLNVDQGALQARRLVAHLLAAEDG
jgi:vanillate monooxygenase